MRAVAAYRRTDLASASNEDLLLRLLEKSLQHMQNADTAMEDGRRADWLHSLHFARAIILELANAFDLSIDPEVSTPILTTYRWILHHLVEAGRTGDRTRLAKVREATETLLESWTEAVQIARDSGVRAVAS